MDTLRTHFAHLPPAAECLAILVGCAQVTIFGLNGLANPLAFSHSYGLPITSTPGPKTLSTPNTTTTTTTTTDPPSSSEDTPLPQSPAQRTHTGLIRALAARNLANGVLLLTFACYVRDRRALGLTMATNTVVTVADTLVAKFYGTEGAVGGHVIGIVDTVGLGFGLLFWGREGSWW